jgi:hypothetical protein
LSYSLDGVILMQPSFERFAGACALLTGITSFLYALAFVILQNALLSALFLMVAGLLSSPVLVAIYYRLRETNAPFALWALVLGIAGALGSAVHGGYDLANTITPSGLASTKLPNPIDPRGLLTFGVAGVALFIVGWLIIRGGRLPRGLGYLAYLSALLLVVLYLGRLIIVVPSSPVIVVPALLSGFVVNPALYILLGFALLSGRTVPTERSQRLR